MIRTMRNAFKGDEFYRSKFDTDTGALVRVTDPSTVKDLSGYCRPSNGWKEAYKWRRNPFSPSPETIDVSITNWCNMGCEYCYQDSTVRGQHADLLFVADVIRAFDYPPYQVAIGGGEPTSHPEFPAILASVAALESVPNYTTAGHIMRDDVISATRKFCGGVSLTYHAFKGLDWFRSTYASWKTALAGSKVQLNVHLILDSDVVHNLAALRTVDREMSLVLLAYYPDVGRGTLGRLPRKSDYSSKLPGLINRCVDDGMKVAFSEGLLPYFLSRPEIKVNTTFAAPSEGHFSAYIDPRGYMTASSFDPPRDSGLRFLGSLREGTLQKAWDAGFPAYYGRLGACYSCALEDRCAQPEVHHALLCAFASHNSKSGQQPLERQ